MTLSFRAIALCLAFAVLPVVAAPEDPFQYLEDPADPRTQAFLREQDARAREALERLPGRKAMLERVGTLAGSATLVTGLALGGTRVFYLKQAPGHEAPVLCMREGLAGAERVLLDPRTLAAGAAIDWMVPAPDGRHVALGVSAAGSGDAVLRVLAADGAKLLPLGIDRTRFNAGLAWHPDARSFYYSRLPEAGAGSARFAHVRVYRHVLGRASDRDEIVFASGVGGALDVPELAMVSLRVPADSRYAYAIARHGPRREMSLHVAEQRDLALAKPRWRKLAAEGDGVLDIEPARNEVYLLSRRGAPRHRVLRLRADAPGVAAARPLVAEGESVIEGMGLARDALYLRTVVGGVDRLERVPFGLLGVKAPEYVRTPFDNAISQLVTSPRSDGAILRLQGWIDPPAVVQVDRRGDLKPTSIQPALAASFAEMDEVRLYAPAADGVKVPVTLVYAKSTRLSGDNRTLLAVFGAYGRVLSPQFDPARLAWLERGGVLAVAHVRGGGEFGEGWREAGRGAAKANAVNDLLAVARFLQSYGFTGPARLALEARGAGAIVAGAALARAPELFAAGVVHAPLADLLRLGQSPLGRASAAEFGAASQELSPYHLPRERSPHPAMLIGLEAGDAESDPWHAAKWAARLQAAEGGKPVLLRLEEPMLAARNRERADTYSFLLWQMGDPAFQPPAPPAPPPPPSAVPLAAPAPPQAPSEPPPAEPRKP